MTTSFNATDLTLSIVLMGGEVFLCLSMWKTGLLARLPWFSAYIFAVTAQDLLQNSLAFCGSYTFYYYTYYATGYTVAVLGLATLIECGRQVLPGFNLPDRDKALNWLFWALGTVVLFAALWPVRFVENRFVIGAYLGIGVTFIFIAGYARYLGFYWSRLVAGICFPLGLLNLFNGAVKAITWHYSYNFASRFRELGPTLNILAVLAWIVAVLSPWGEYDPTDEELAQARQIVDDIEANLRRFAAGGEQ